MKLSFICIVCILLLASFSVHAQWQENGVPVALVTGDEESPEIISDGAGGSIIVWQTYYSYRDSPDIYAQRLDGEGYPLWPAGGVPVCTALNGQYKPQIVSDGAGGAIIAWTDFRNNNADIYAQRIDPDGDPVWEVEGIAVCTVQDTFGWWMFSRIDMIEHPGGAIMTWYDNRSGEEDIYAQRIDTSGTVLWTPGGIAVCTETGDQVSPLAVPDDADGVIVVWVDWRSGERDLYAQRIDADSTCPWAPGGVPVCTAAGDQRKHDAIADGNGGMISVWQDERGVDINLYSQLIDADGMPVWTADGIPVCAETNDQLLPQLATDGREGAIYTWADRRDAVYYEATIYTQRITGAGIAAWPAGGILIREPGGWDNSMPTIVPDGFGGAIIAWFTSEHLPGARIPSPAESSAEDIETIYTQRIAGDGTIWWQEGGLPLCDDPGYTAPRSQKILPDGTGGAVVTWYNVFDMAGIFAQRVNGTGNAPPTGTEPQPIAPFSTRNYPNPFNPHTTIAFAIPEAGHVDLRIYDVAGRLVRILLNEQRVAGSHEEAWNGADDSGTTVASGVYYYRLSAGNFLETRKMVLLR